MLTANEVVQNQGFQGLTRSSFRDQNNWHIWII